MRWRAVVNPSAGRGRTRKLLPRLTDAFAATGLDIDVRVSVDLDDAIRLAREAFGEGRAVAACGGDGTVNALAGVAADHGGVLAIVPTGAGNDFARHLGLDRRRWLEAIPLLTTGQVGTVDLGRAELTGVDSDEDGATVRWFTSVANAGFDSEANRWANGVQWASGTTLYVLAVLRTLGTYRPHRFRLTVDGQTHDIEAWLVAIGNTRGYAGGMLITPGAELDDGQLDVCVVGSVSRAGFLRSFPRVFRGTHVSHPAVDMYRGKVIELASLDQSVPIELYGAGERIGPLPARMEAVPGALQVIVPATAPVPKQPLTSAT
ncbi:MAG TPA: diacylglycerol kinase family protein [Acidimicrobiia bacterium]|jgi:diacylglycerol kinase (ATP)